MTIGILEALPGRDYDRRRGYSAWLFVRFPIRHPYRMKAYHRHQRVLAARAAFVERYGYAPYLVQHIDRSAWWRAGPVEEVTE